MEKTKNILITSIFAAIIICFGAAHLLLSDSAVSLSERRKLAQAPDISSETVFSSEFSGDLEDYLLDQFPLRESFRFINAATRFYAMGQKDSDGIWLHDGSVFKTEYPLKENQITYGAGIINKVCETYLSGMNVFYSIVPDKNYFAAEENGYPAMDYDKLVTLMNDNVINAEYINIFDTLSLSDYYRTDTHWSQDSIFPVVQRLAAAMDTEDYLTPREDYTANSLYPFYGVYMGQAALPVKPDTITYLTSEYIDSAKVTGIDDSVENTVYSPEKLSGMDGYDVFLSGAQSIITIECPNAKTERELIIFRDSFGSSIAPLFTGAYSKITLIDLRYIPVDNVGDYVEFSDQDVLFLYSTLLLNSSMLMK